MARRPTTKLSRKLFSKAPEIKPLDTGNTPSFALGKEKSLTPLRSDIAGIRVKEGEDFLTFDLFKNAVREGRIKVSKYDVYGRRYGRAVMNFIDTNEPTTNPTLEDYYGWRKEFMNRDARRVRTADTRLVRIGRVDDPKLLSDRNIRVDEKGNIVSTKEIETDREYLGEGERPLFRGGRERYVRGGIYWRYDETGLNQLKDAWKGSTAKERLKDLEEREKKAEDVLFERKLVQLGDVYKELPLMPYETKGMTTKQKEEFFEKEKQRVKDIAEGRRDLPFSLTDEVRKKKANVLAESREGMSRAQQRKLGRVIRDGKTGPQTRTRKFPFTEDEERNVYDVIEYQPKKFDFVDREAVLEYTYGFNKGKEETGVIDERQQLSSVYKGDDDRLRELDGRFNALYEEKRQLLAKYVDKLDKDDWWVRDTAKLLQKPLKTDRVERYVRKGLNPFKTTENDDEEIYKERYDKVRSHYERGLRDAPKGFDPLMTPEERKLFIRTDTSMEKLKDEVFGIISKKRTIRENFNRVKLSNAPEQVVNKKRVVVRNKKELNDALAEMRKLTAESGLAKDIMTDFYTTSKYDRYMGKDATDKKNIELKKQYGKEGAPQSDDKIHYTLHSTYSYGAADANSLKDAQWLVEYKKRYKFYGLDDDKGRKEFNRGGSRGRTERTGVYHTPLQLDDRYGDNDAKRFDVGTEEGKKYLKKTYGKNPILDMNDDEANDFLRKEGILKGDTFEKRKYPESNFKHNETLMNKDFKDWYGISGFKEVPMDSETGFLALQKVGSTEEVMDKGMRYNQSVEDKLFVGKDGKIKVRLFKGKKQRPIKKVRVVKQPKRDLFGNADFVMRVGSGKGRRVFHTEEGDRKGWKETSINKYTKQSDNWKSLDVDTTPAAELQLRGLRDKRTGRGRLIGRGRLDPRRIDRSKEYKSARNEALIQMRINETAGVRDAKDKADKEIKDIRISEAQKALNLKLQKETAEKTAEGLKAKNAGLVHSYNVNVRNATAATLLGSDPIELNKILKQGGGLALIKTMIRKGEIVDASTIGQLNISSKQKENLLRLLSEGGDFIEGQEYFFRTLDDFGRTIVQRGYLNKGGERKNNLELMKITTNEDGTQSTDRFIVPKAQILAPDDYTTTTSSGKKQKEIPPTLTDFELDLFGGAAPTPKPKGVIIKQDPISGVKSLVKSKGAGIAEPSPKPQQSLLSTLQQQDQFDTMGGDLLTLDPAEFSDESATSEEAFEFGGDAPLEPEPDLSGTPYGIRPKPQQPTIDEELSLLGGGEADEIAEILGGGIPETYAQTLSAADDEYAKSEEEFAQMEAFLKGQREKELAEALQKAEETSPEAGGLTIDEILSPKAKKVSISDEVKELFVKDTAIRASVVPKEWSASNDDVPEQLLRDSWDFRGRGLNSRLDAGGTQEIPEGYIAVWTTKWAPKDNQTALVINESDAYYLMRGLRNVNIRNDKGKSNPISDAKLKSFYRKVVEGIRNGRKETAFNDQQLLRGLDMIEPAAPVSP